MAPGFLRADFEGGRGGGCEEGGAEEEGLGALGDEVEGLGGSVEGGGELVGEFRGGRVLDCAGVCSHCGGDLWNDMGHLVVDATRPIRDEVERQCRRRLTVVYGKGMRHGKSELHMKAFLSYRQAST